MSNKGFTTIELLVNISLVLLLSGLVITYNRIGERQIIFIKERAKFVDTLYKAKSLSVQTFSDTVTPCGFGVEIANDLREYILFRDLPNDDNGECSSADNSYLSRSNEDELIERNFLEEGIEFNVPGIQPYSIVFIPPDPDVVISSLGDPRREIRITMKDEHDSESTIIVTKFGQINVDSNDR